MGSRTSECGSFAFESKIDLNHHLQFRYITTLPPNLTIHHPHPSSPSSPSNGVANGFSWTPQAFQLTFHLGNLSFRATHTKHTWKDGMGEWGGSLRKLGVVFFVWGADIILGLQILLLGILFQSCCWGFGLAKMCSQWMREEKQSDVMRSGYVRNWFEVKLEDKSETAKCSDSTRENKTVPCSLRKNGPKVAWYNQTEKLC